MKKNKFPPTSLLVGIVLFGIVSFILFWCGPELVRSRLQQWGISNENYGQIGDVFGGTLGPLIAWIAAILTFAAFYIQYVANKEQRDQFAKQADDTIIERFENRFFEMIRIHRSNVEELNIQEIVKGRKTFTTFYFELRYIYFVLNRYHNEYTPESGLTEEQLTNLAYLIFFFGIGHVTVSVFQDLTPKYADKVFFIKTIERLTEEKGKFFRSNEKADLVIRNGESTSVFRQIYEPFTGHGTKIGHYYRHLFQSVKYVHEQKSSLFTHDVKYSYVKMLRAQLSNFEQILFYYNAVSLIGEPWITKGYIVDYNLINNIPLSFTDFGIRPEEKFKEVLLKKPDFFDWLVLKNEMSK